MVLGVWGRGASLLHGGQEAESEEGRGQELDNPKDLVTSSHVSSSQVYGNFPIVPPVWDLVFNTWTCGEHFILNHNNIHDL
jgi:hypothetical protein